MKSTPGEEGKVCVKEREIKREGEIGKIDERQRTQI